MTHLSKKDKYRHKIQDKIGFDRQFMMPHCGHLSATLCNANVDIDKISDRELWKILNAMSGLLTEYKKYWYRQGHKDATVEILSGELRKLNNV
jgi:hypothetical protein